jgi:hypothetical protein
MLKHIGMGIAEVGADLAGAVVAGVVDQVGLGLQQLLQVLR